MRRPRDRGAKANTVFQIRQIAGECSANIRSAKNPNENSGALSDPGAAERDLPSHYF